MAGNRIFEHGKNLSLVATHPTTPASGKPLRVGQMTGVAVTDEGDGGNAATATSADLGPSVYDLSVKGVDDAGNSAVAVGDPLFYVDADIGSGTGFLSKKSSGYFFGFALEVVTSGATDTIRVLNLPNPGPGTADILAGAIGTSELAADAVTGAKIADDAVDSEHIAAGAIDAEHMAANSVDSAAYVDGSIDPEHLAASAVETAKIAAAAVTKAKASVFASTEQTGTGSPQNVAHGLAAVPALVLVAVTEVPDAAAETGFDVAEGAHDATNVIVTVTNTVKFKVLAWA